MSKTRVYEVARQLNMEQKTLVSLFQSLGFSDVRNHMSAVEADALERVKRHVESQKTLSAVEKRDCPTVVKRKAVSRPPSDAPQKVPEEVRDIASRLVQRRTELATAVQDMARLLTVSQANVATMRNQPWYGRIWATMARSNRRLAEQNEANLLEVQRLALTVLTVLPEMDELAARSIALLQHQVRILTYSDHGTKLQLEELAKRCATRFAEHEQRISSIEMDHRFLKWIHSRYDENESVQYDKMPPAKRVLLMTDRFMDLTAFAWDEQAVHGLLNALQDANVQIDENWTLRRFGVRLYSEWLALLDPSQNPGLLTISITDSAGGEFGPVQSLVIAMLRFRRTGYAVNHLNAAFEHLLGLGLDLDKEVSVRDLVRSLLEESRIAAEARLPQLENSQASQVSLPPLEQHTTRIERMGEPDCAPIEAGIAAIEPAPVASIIAPSEIELRLAALERRRISMSSWKKVGVGGAIWEGVKSAIPGLVFVVTFAATGGLYGWYPKAR